jgi:hypothetical protein
MLKPRKKIGFRGEYDNSNIEADGCKAELRWSGDEQVG